MECVGLFMCGKDNYCLTAASFSSVIVDLFCQFYSVFIHKCMDVASFYMIVVV